MKRTEQMREHTRRVARAELIAILQALLCVACMAIAAALAFRD